MKILDVCCGSKMFWFIKEDPDVTFMDIRELDDVLCDGRELHIHPDIIGDFRNIPFDDNTYDMVVFDPPHLKSAGANSYLVKKYGMLSDNWQRDLQLGFHECMRVIKHGGILIFKWNEHQICLSDILRLTNYIPLFGNRRGKTYWLVFMKNDRFRS